MIPRASAGYTVVYDGDCAVCLRFIDYLRRRDPAGTIEIVPYQEDGVRARFPWIDPARFEEALQLVGPGTLPRETWEGARAIEQLLRVLPRGSRLGWVFRLPFARSLFAWGYRNFARNRRRFGCGEHCSVETVGDPSPEIARD